MNNFAALTARTKKAKERKRKRSCKPASPQPASPVTISTTGIHAACALHTTVSSTLRQLIRTSKHRTATAENKKSRWGFGALGKLHGSGRGCAVRRPSFRQPSSFGGARGSMRACCIALQEKKNRFDTNLLTACSISKGTARIVVLLRILSAMEQHVVSWQYLV